MTLPLTDSQREQVIGIARALAMGSSEFALRKYWTDLLLAEMRNRSAEQIERMEMPEGK